jgi:hypothetical protein
MVRDVGELPTSGVAPASLISLAQRGRGPRAGQERKVEKKIDKKLDRKIKAGGKR